MFASLRRRLPRLGRLPRLCAVGICLLLAAESAAASRTPRSAAHGAATVAVTVAARTLPAGHALRRGDLRVVRWPVSLRPAGAGAPATLLGRRLIGPVSAGEPITGTRVLGRDLAAALPSGTVAAALPIADGHVLDLVRPGDQVDLLAAPRAPDDPATSSDGPVTTLARSALTMAVFGDGPTGGAEIVLALPRAAAVSATRASATHMFTVVLAPP